MVYLKILLREQDSTGKSGIKFYGIYHNERKSVIKVYRISHNIVAGTRFNEENWN